MCKLSLWLVSLDPKLPFSFVDDKVLPRQLAARPHRASTSSEACTSTRDSDHQRRSSLFDRRHRRHASRKAVDLRQRLATEVDDDDPQRSAHAKRRQLARAPATSPRNCADRRRRRSPPGFGSAASRARRSTRPTRTCASPSARPSRADGDGRPRPCSTSIIDARPDPDRRDRLRALAAAALGPRGAGRDVTRRLRRHHRQPAVPGRPEAHRRAGHERARLACQRARGRATRAAPTWWPTSSCARSACSRRQGNLGLIATNTVAQGDTREVGLDQMVGDGLHHHPLRSRAGRGRRPAPTSSTPRCGARRGQVAVDVPRVADGVAGAAHLDAARAGGTVDGEPVRLAENAGIAFQGCIVLGMGSCLSPRRRQRGSRRTRGTPRCCSRTSTARTSTRARTARPSRWVIDFNDRSESERAELPAAVRSVSSDGQARARQGQPQGVSRATGGSSRERGPDAEGDRGPGRGARHRAA